ncbi:hypothetical protein KP509_17G030600 [Ceratopteris richardii]|uniref:TAFII28-like protein domain-containing protein n=1 Tax=Ceratopteris richardii TaxID=49495 RepID=A0A8T2SWM9_CERRI|nr:hypothetical protein KP509_17G030600 [Ceratopteris richardii]
MKRTAAEMEGGPEDEEEDEDEEEGDAEDDEEEIAEDKERPMLQQQGEDAEDFDIGEGDDNLDEDLEEQQPILRMPKPAEIRERKGGSDDEDEKGAASSLAMGTRSVKGKDEEEEDEEPLDVEYAKSQTIDPERIQAIMAEFTKDQMSRYECYRRSNFPKANMRRLLQSVAGCPISIPMTIVMSGIAKMFVGELVETGRTVMTERKETGPLRPCHIREAHRRLKLKGKVPLRSRPRLFH